MISGLNMDRGAEAKEGDMGREGGPGKLYKEANVEALKEREKEIMDMNLQQEDIINKPEPKVRFRVF